MLHVVDIILVFVYLAGTITIGIVCRGKQQNADDYFTASGSMKSVFQTLLVGLSIAATLFSGITFMVQPSIAFSYGIGVLLTACGFIYAGFILRFWFLKRYLAGTVHHPYEIIEKRLGPHARTLSALMYLCLRIGWMAALIYAPTIGILGAAGLGDQWFWPIILMIGITSTIYTTIGGIRGVIITDALQFLVIAIGSVLAVGFVVVRLPVSFEQITEVLNQKGRLSLDFSTDPTKLITFWTMVIGAGIGHCCNYIADQMSLQRYLSTGSIKAASSSFRTNVIGATLVITLLTTVGLSLVVWYHFVPDTNLPSNPDMIFPYFISSQLPIGVAGILLAAILAATMSSMTSGINTLSAVLTFDFRARFGKKQTHEQQLKFGKRCSLVVGFASTISAGYIGALGTIYEITTAVLGLFLAPLLAVMLFAVTRAKISFLSIALGISTGVFAAGCVIFSPVANTWTSTTGFLVTLISSSLYSLIGVFIRKIK